MLAARVFTKPQEYKGQLFKRHVRDAHEYRQNNLSSERTDQKVVSRLDKKELGMFVDDFLEAMTRREIEAATPVYRVINKYSTVQPS